MLASCTAGGSSGEVDWDNYSPSVKARIDRMASEGDCTGLQTEFDQAEANNDLQRERVGDGNADLMSYIDEQMRSARCYG